MDKHGVLNINKPKGVTSFDVVREVRRVLGAKKVGHGGTLDPPAEGVLLILVGEATKIFPYLLSLEKEYDATMLLGVTTSTQDSEGEVLCRIEPNVGLQEIEQAFLQFQGQREQIPPMVSAKRYRGKRLYELFYQGNAVERSPQKVEIKILKLVKYEPPLVRFRIVCSSGTYVRTLCHDIGQALGCGAHLKELVRLRIGKFSIENALPLEKRELFREKILPLSEALSHLSPIVVTQRMADEIRMGKRIKISEIRMFPSCEPGQDIFRVYDEEGNLVAMARKKSDFPTREFKLLRVFNDRLV